MGRSQRGLPRHARFLSFASGKGNLGRPVKSSSLPLDSRGHGARMIADEAHPEQLVSETDFTEKRMGLAAFLSRCADEFQAKNIAVESVGAQERGDRPGEAKPRFPSIDRGANRTGFRRKPGVISGRPLCLASDWQRRWNRPNCRSLGCTPARDNSSSYSASPWCPGRSWRWLARCRFP